MVCILNGCGFQVQDLDFQFLILIVPFLDVLIQNKLQNLAGQHSDVLETLSPNVRKRVEFLREIQVCVFSNLIEFLSLSDQF